MSTPPASPPMVEVSGGEARWLPEDSARRLVYPRRESAVVRPGRTTWEYGRLASRTPASAAAVPAAAASHVDEVRTATVTDRTVAVAGPVDVITDPAHATLRLRPKTVSGFRIARVQAR
ncbi:hypothetical protein QFZ66_002045 [Streptomyces sp. B4I13]|uniref:pyridoxamine 5'-phosphate oxidase family protein n=1 Tax=Streptomyces sp. B4I13 TaxID=3042271 RepID=UPI0027840AED|nr:pyridoxamine 5'-phosphate oxidase family protein [Streptomyces sp. B4I13]MDQ0958167.1 hypothetical protein [Streptomyces sp. B4I13]